MKLVQEVNVEELFAELDTEEDGNVYIKEVIVTLKALNHDLDHNLRVKNFLDELDTESKTVTLEEFKDLMVALEEAGWRKQKPKKAKEITDLDLKAVFRLVDVDRSGNISRTEAKMAAKLLMKRFGIKDVPSWMKQFDEDMDGRLSYREFKTAILPQSEDTSSSEAKGPLADETTDTSNTEQTQN